VTLDDTQTQLEQFIAKDVTSVMLVDLVLLIAWALIPSQTASVKFALLVQSPKQASPNATNVLQENSLKIPARQLAPSARQENSHPPAGVPFVRRAIMAGQLQLQAQMKSWTAMLSMFRHAQLGVN